MKKVFLILIGLVVVVLGVLVTASFFAKSIIAKLQPQIEEQASSILGSRVALGTIDVGFWPNVYLETKGLAVGTGSAAPKVGAFKAALGVMPLFSGKIAIREISISAPSVTLVKGASGVTIEGLPLPKPATDSAKAATPSKPTSEASAGTAAPNLPITIDLESFALSGATVTFIDQSAGKTYQITDAALSTKVSLQSNVLAVPDLRGSLLVQGAPLNFSLRGKFSPTVVDLTEATLQAFDGKATITASGELQKHIAATVQAQGFDASKALALIDQELSAMVSGSLKEFSSKISVSFAGATGAPVVAGDGTFALANGGLKGVNLIAPVVKAIEKSVPTAPGSANALELSPAEQHALDSPDTTFTALSGVFVLGKDSIALDRTVIETALFDLTAKGSSSFGGTVNMQASTLLSPRLTKALVTRNKSFSKVVNEQGRFEAPVIIQGTVPKLVVIPDLGKILQNILAGEVGEKLGNALGKALGGGKAGNPLKALGF